MVPIPSWLTKTRESVTDDPQKFSTELSIIYKYSPFKTEAELMQQFDVIYGKCGKIIKTQKFWWKYLFSVSYGRHYVYVFIFILFIVLCGLSHGASHLFYPCNYITFILRESKNEYLWIPNTRRKVYTCIDLVKMDKKRTMQAITTVVS